MYAFTPSTIADAKTFIENRVCRACFSIKYRTFPEHDEAGAVGLRSPVVFRL